jgi:hypothetical protein
MKIRKIEKLTIFRAPYLGESPTSCPWSIMHTDPPTRIVRIKNLQVDPSIKLHLDIDPSVIFFEIFIYKFHHMKNSYENS